MAKDQAPPDAPIMPVEEVQALLEAAERDGSLVKRPRDTAETVPQRFIRRDVN